MTPLTIKESPTSTGIALEVAGDLDYTSAPQLRQAAHTTVLSSGRRLTMDLGGLEFCDSSGITALIAVRNHAVSAGAEVLLVAVPAHLRRLLDLTGLDQVFDMRERP
ncbi:STAS domain-containing protein [Streptomyces pilosus]|uniref:STAS domain-containing protein n=1 Tax=Streptomyces pilosus TaxID=28893 RepID=UPI0035977E95